jgi:U3 small nucleolar ribonucleoprotein protein IMP4
VPTTSQTSSYYMNIEGHLVRSALLLLSSISSTYPPDAMIVSHFPHGPTLYFTLHNVTLRHDIESYRSSTVSEQYPHLIFENFSSRLGERVRDCLKYLFPVPKEESKRVMTFSTENDFISFRWVNITLARKMCGLRNNGFRHHVFVKTSSKEVQLAEVGPRFELKRTFQGVFVTTD